MKKCSLIILLNLFINGGLFAQYSNLISHDIILEMDNARQILSGDIDNDGDEDLLELFINKIIWFENDQKSYTTFHPITISDSLWIHQIDIGDIDNDGDLDLVSVGNYLAIFFNDGHQNFDETIIYDKKINAEHIALGDLDSDNRMDILVVGGSDYFIQWFKNYGDSPFEKKSTLRDFKNINKRTTRIEAVYLMDFDKNGTNDIILNNDRSELNRYWLSNDGHAIFTEAPFIANNIEISPFIIEDINSDGFYDVVGLTKVGQSCFLNDGSNSFDLVSALEVSQDGKIRASGDFNGDGHADLVYSSTTERHIYCYLNKGEHTGILRFDDPDTLVYGSNEMLEDILPLDFDQDGDLDIFCATSTVNKLLVYENNGLGKFDLKQTIQDNDRYYVSFSLNDMDGDSVVELIFGSVNYERLFGIYSISKTGKESYSIPNQITNLKANNVIVANLNNDSYPDILGGSEESLFWLKNFGDNKYSEPIIFDSLLGNFSHMYAADLDANNYQDLLISSYNSSRGKSLFWFPNVSGDFSGQKELIVPDSIKLYYPDDINEDGLVDLLIAHSNNSFYLYSNKGNLDFDLHALAQNQNQSQKAISSADLNNDGRKDILTFYYDFDSYKTIIGWYENLGDNNFGQISVIHDEFSYSDWRYGNKILTSDLDLNGYQDIILSSSDISLILYNLGDGNFIHPTDFVGADCLATQDMDEDGDPDLVVSDEWWFSLRWYENLLNSVYTYNQTICEGDSVMFFDNWYLNQGTYSQIINNQNGGKDYFNLNLEVDDEHPEKIIISGHDQVNELEKYLYSVEDEEFTDFYWQVNFGEIELLKSQTKAEISWTKIGENKIDVVAIKPRSGCKTESSLFVEVTEMPHEKIIIYPNPSQDFITIKPTINLVYVDIIDAAGRTVIKTTNENRIDISFLNVGLYVVSLKDESGKQFGWKKLIIN